MSRDKRSNLSLGKINLFLHCGVTGSHWMFQLPENFDETFTFGLELLNLHLSRMSVTPKKTAADTSHQGESQRLGHSCLGLFQEQEELVDVNLEVSGSRHLLQGGASVASWLELTGPVSTGTGVPGWGCQ